MIESRRDLYLNEDTSVLLPTAVEWVSAVRRALASATAAAF